MAVYIAEILITILLNYLINPYKSKNNRRIYLILVFLMLFLVAGLRGYSVGTDTGVYVRMFVNINRYNMAKTRYEKGFLLYLKLLYAINSNPRFFLLVSSFITTGIVFSFIYKYSHHACLSVLLYIMLRAYFSQMNTLREALAVSLCIAGYSILLDENKKWRYIKTVCWIILSTTIHSSMAIAIIPVIIWRLFIENPKKDVSPWRLINLILIVSIAIYFGYSFVMSAATVLFPKYARYFSGKWSDANYFASLMKTLVSLTFLIVGTIYISRHKKLDKTYRFAYLMLGGAVITGVLSMRMEIWGRISGLFTIFTPLLWTPEFIRCIPTKEEKRYVTIIILICAWLYMFIILKYRPEWDSVIPYVLG